MYESEATTGYSHYYRRYPEAPVYSSASAEASTDFSSEEIRHIYENSELTKEVKWAAITGWFGKDVSATWSIFNPITSTTQFNVNEQSCWVAAK